MQFYDDFNERGAYGVRELWQDAMHHPGCAQLKYLKDLMESVDFINGKADDSLLLLVRRSATIEFLCLQARIIFSAMITWEMNFY